MNKLNLFIEKARKKHGDKYDYSKVEYINSLTKVCIICPEHGEFWQKPVDHVRGHNCPLCSNKKRGDTFRLGINDFIEKSKKVHGDKYDYSKVEYVNDETKVCIICPEHGEFMMKPSNHIIGQGCPKCAGRGLNTDEIIDKFRKVHGDKYDYSKVVYKKMHDKVCIICPEHGEFWQTPSKHIKGQNCPKCAKKNASIVKTLTNDEFIDKAKQIHGDEYDYSECVYKGTYENVDIICKKHGKFSQMANSHLNGHGCPICGNNKSLFEDEVSSYIENELGIRVENKNRTILEGNHEIDIFAPEFNIAIECDGLYWHSEQYKENDYHLKKTNECNQKGIRLIHIFEDEWMLKKDIVKSMLKSIFNNIDKKIYARKCDIRIVNNEDCKNFLNANHIQGYISGKIKLGLYYGNELVSLMTFGDKRISLGSKPIDGEYELLRFCNKLNTTVIGGASKLFKYFIKNYSPKQIISYCDLRWSEGNLYKKLEFKEKYKTKPNYFYIIGNNRKNRFKFRKSELIKKGYDPNKTEHEIMKDSSIYRIYDCGSILWVFTP